MGLYNGRMVQYLHCVITESDNGGMTMDSYTKESSAINRAKEIVNHIRKNNINYKVYLSIIPYDSKNNTILTDKWITEESQQLI